MLIDFVRYPDGNSEIVTAAEVVTRLAPRCDVRQWVDLEDPSDADVREVGAAFGLDAEALRDCLEGEQRPRIDEFENHIFVLCYGILSNHDHTTFTPQKLCIFCGESFLVTVHRTPLPTLREVREHCGLHAAQALARGVDFVLYMVIDGLVDKYALVADGCEEALEELELMSLDVHAHGLLLKEQSVLRQRLIELRRVTLAQRDMLQPFVRGEYDYISGALEQRFSHVHDHLTKVIEQLDNLRERLSNVRENYHTAVAVRTNEIMKTLTMFATVMLPLTLVAGIYGMNLRFWPPQEEPYSFGFVLACMAAITLVLVVYFRRKRWL